MFGVLLLKPSQVTENPFTRRNTVYLLTCFIFCWDAFYFNSVIHQFLRVEYGNDERQRI